MKGMAEQGQDEKREQEDFPVSDREVEACMRRANSLNDVLFKYLFASKGREENLLRLLNDTLGSRRGIVSLEYLDREKDPRRHEGRGSFVDVLARSCDGRICHVEVQLNREGASITNNSPITGSSNSESVSIATTPKLAP